MTMSKVQNFSQANGNTPTCSLKGQHATYHPLSQNRDGNGNPVFKQTDNFDILRTMCSRMNPNLVLQKKNKQQITNMQDYLRSSTSMLLLHEIIKQPVWGNKVVKVQELQQT